MNPETILQKGDCEVARTPEELIVWIESVYVRFGADDVTRNYARMGKGLSKPFFEEIMPLGHLARHKYLGRHGLYLRPKIGNQNFDAEIIDTSSGEEHITRVEILTTYLDYDYALRTEYLIRQGWVSLSGSVCRDGTSAAGGQVQAEMECENRQGRLDDLIANIEKRVAAKLDKNYSMDTILVVVFDDYLLDLSSELPRLKTYFQDTLSSQVLGKFRGLFIVGRSGRTFFEFGETP